MLEALCVRKIKRKGGEFDKCKVHLVVQKQHIRWKGEDSVGDYDNVLSLVPAASGFSTILSLAIHLNLYTDHVDISQAFVQWELLPGDGHNGKVYIFPPPGYPKDPFDVYRLLTQLYNKNHFTSTFMCARSIAGVPCTIA